MEEMNKEFEIYWKNQYENKIMPIVQKNELRKVAYHAFVYAYQKAQKDFSSGACS